MASSRNLSTSLKKLDISQDKKPAPRAKQPADSWEDEASTSSDSDSDTENESQPPSKKPQNEEPPGTPPPTPASPSFNSNKYQTFPPFGFDKGPENEESNSATRKEGESKRPETSMAVASRLIAAGLGQRAPKRTPEQRQYDQALRAQERKKREAVKEEEGRKKREKEKALKDVWED
ncbi:hypothetical protein MBLNU230_g7617t1 [Neophaeotheca triangularis]